MCTAKFTCAQCDHEGPVDEETVFRREQSLAFCGFDCMQDYDDDTRAFGEDEYLQEAREIDEHLAGLPFEDCAVLVTGLDDTSL